MDKSMSFGNTVANILNIIRREKLCNGDCVSQNAISAGYALKKSTEELWPEVSQKIVKIVLNEIPKEFPNVTVWWYSVLLRIWMKEELFLEFVRYVNKNHKSFSAATQYFLFYQLMVNRFLFKEIDVSGKAQQELWQFYIKIVDGFADQIDPGVLREIPLQERNKDVVIVITEQFLDAHHGPTKTALDRCKTLMTHLGKEVYLINTAEVLTSVGKIPFFNIYAANKIPELQGQSRQIWKDVSIPFYQCKGEMPDLKEIDMILRQIREMAPGLIIGIGKGGILANLAGKMVPMLTIGLCPSELEFTSAKYQTLGRQLNMQDRELLKNVGYTEAHVIESVFTSGLKTQTEHITRLELGLQDDWFIMLVVGIRLDTEVTSEFMGMMENALEENMRVVFCGIFENYAECMESFPRLKEQSVYLGVCEDILSRVELCDLYINPTRRGGGTSCVEAMYKGLPVVTVNYGDVAVNAGEEFCVKDYNEMAEMIRKYAHDKAFYEDKSQRAKERSEVLLDTDGEFVKILQEMGEEKDGNKI